MDTLYCYLLQVRVSTFLRAGFRMREQERLHKGPGGEVRDAKTNIVHTTVPWKAPDTLFGHMRRWGEGAGTLKEFSKQNRSTFFLTSTSDHLAPQYSWVYPFIVIWEASGKRVEISGPLIAENQIDCNKITQKLSPRFFSKVINTLGEALTMISHPEGSWE